MTHKAKKKLSQSIDALRTASLPKAPKKVPQQVRDLKADQKRSKLPEVYVKDPCAPSHIF